jgi:molecular chaperone GrpE
MKDAEPEMENANPAAAPEPLVAVESVPPTPQQIEELKARAAKADEHWDRLLRATADFDNFKKRAARERQEAARYANQALLESLLPVLDHFEMALAAAPSGATGQAHSLQAGFALVYQQFRNALLEAGLEEIDATGQPFDPKWHEAVSQQQTLEAPDGHVLQQLRKGYRLRDRLLRPAGVVVAQKPAGPGAIAKLWIQK